MEPKHYVYYWPNIWLVLAIRFKILALYRNLVKSFEYVLGRTYKLPSWVLVLVVLLQLLDLLFGQMFTRTITMYWAELPQSAINIKYLQYPLGTTSFRRMH
jgi:hypothetical protein